LSPKSQLISPSRPKGEHVWVDSSFLRRFFSCQDNLEDLFRGAICRGTVLRRESFVCEHSQGLHPRVAREGISNSFPSSYFSILYNEGFACQDSVRGEADGLESGEEENFVTSGKIYLDYVVDTRILYEGCVCSVADSITVYRGKKKP